jgi:hypothetical protein
MEHVSRAEKNVVRESYVCKNKGVILEIQVGQDRRILALVGVDDDSK